MKENNNESQDFINCFENELKKIINSILEGLFKVIEVTEEIKKQEETKK